MWVGNRLNKGDQAKAMLWMCLCTRHMPEGKPIKLSI